MRCVLVLAAVAVVVSACDKTSEEYASAPAEAPAAPADAAAGPERAGGEAKSAPLPVSAPTLAYSYRYGIEAPADELTGLIRRHEQACVAAGSAVCQMVGQSVERRGKDRVSGELSLRAAPDWLTRFRDGLEAQAKAAGGRIVSSSTESDDLTRSITDTEAHIRARTTLRDRLQAVLAARPGKLSDLLEVEQELARVQQEIDAAQSSLAVMRTRVATSALTIRYESEGNIFGAIYWLVGAILLGLALWSVRQRVWPVKRPAE